MNNRRWLFIALLAAAALPAAAQTNASVRAEDEQAVRAVLREYDDARVRRDADAMQRILADDFTSITPDGSLNSRTQFMATFMSADSKLQGVERAAITVRFYGDTAVVTSEATPKMVWPDGRVAAPVGQRTTTVLVKRPGGWQIVASQGTPIRQPPQRGGAA